MAKQCGPLFIECTWDDITFYQMEGKYYARWKSSLTREKVLTDPAFAKTRLSAEQLGIASKISSSIYSDLPIGWRQKWMHEQFTGEAKIMLQNEQSPQEAYDYLWKTYVEYWVLYQHVTGIPLKTGRTFKKKEKSKSYKTILKHRGGDDKYTRRYYNQLGKRHRRSKYDHTKDLQAIDEKRERKALNDAAYQRLLDKEKEQRAKEKRSARLRTRAIKKEPARHNHPLLTYRIERYRSQRAMMMTNTIKQRSKIETCLSRERNSAMMNKIISNKPPKEIIPV